MEEEITKRPDRCVASGTVVLEHDPQAGILEYEFDGPGTNSDAEGVLRRDDS